MLEMALPHLHRFGSCSVAAVTVGMGLIAQANAEPSVSQLGVGTSIIGATYLIIAFSREVGPQILKWSEIQATARNDRVRTEEALKNATAQLDALRAENAKIRADLEATDARADASAIAAVQAKADADLARRLADEAKARAEALEKRVRETGNLVRNQAQDIVNTKRRVSDIEQVVSGSGERDPEAAI
jgi:hypothetical protein